MTCPILEIRENLRPAKDAWDSEKSCNSSLEDNWICMTSPYDGLDQDVTMEPNAKPLAWEVNAAYRLLLQLKFDPDTKFGQDFLFHFIETGREYQRS